MVTTPIRPELHTALAKAAGDARDARDTLTSTSREARDIGLIDACPDLLAALNRASDALCDIERIAFQARG